MEVSDLDLVRSRMGQHAIDGWLRLPIHMQRGVFDYLVHGHPVGDFLFAVMSNDLAHAFMRADDINEQNMKGWARFLIDVMPIPAWGSEENVRKWQKEGGLKGYLKKLEETHSSPVPATTEEGETDD